MSECREVALMICVKGEPQPRYWSRVTLERVDDRSFRMVPDGGETVVVMRMAEELHALDDVAREFGVDLAEQSGDRGE